MFFFSLKLLREQLFCVKLLTEQLFGGEAMKSINQQSKRNINAGKLVTLLFSIHILIFILLQHSINPVTSLLSAYTSPNHSSIVSIYIKQGDTLWSVASLAITDKEDIRDKVIEIRYLNHFSANQHLVPGQIIQVPIKKSANDFQIASRTSRE